MLGEQKILVTGTGGFIGGWLAETLYLNNPKCIRAGVHSWVGAARPARFPMEIVPCDILNPEQVYEAVKGMSCVIHCAKGSTEDSIIQGTKNLLEAALEQKVNRFIYISTTEVYNNFHGRIDETTPLRFSGNLYGDSKIKAEQLCWDYSDLGLFVTVIRPPIVYGPFSKTWTVNIAQKLMSGNWNIYDNQGEGKCNLIYISDLVTGILLAASNEGAIGEAFNLNGPEVPTWNEYFKRYNSALLLPELTVISSSKARAQASILEPIRTGAKFVRDHYSVPVKNLAAKNSLIRRMLKFMETKIKTSPRISDFDLFNRQTYYVSNKAQTLLGFNPRFDLDAGLELTIPWLIQVGLVDQSKF